MEDVFNQTEQGGVKMIEISLTEIVLLVWAGLATASWLHAREDARVGKKLLQLLIENKDAREQIIKAYEKSVREHREEA